MRARTRLAMGALLVLVVAACGGASPDPDGRSTAELEALYRARTDSARTRFTEADVRFMTGMIGHHAQALVMASLAPTHGAGPSLRTLAARIINSQQDEIDWMQQWLRERNEPVPEVMIEGTELVVHGAEHTLHMPGMLTPEQMLELDEARGTAFDRLFLTYMIQHHRGGRHDGPGAVRDGVRSTGPGGVQTRVRRAGGPSHRNRAHGAHARRAARGQAGQRSLIPLPCSLDQQRNPA